MPEFYFTKSLGTGAVAGARARSAVTLWAGTVATAADHDTKGASVQDSGIKMAIVRKPELKVMGWVHEYPTAEEMFKHFPGEMWGTLNSVSGQVSGTRGYEFHDSDLVKNGEGFHTIGIEVPLSVDEPLPGMFLRTIPSSIYAVFYREPGTDHDVFAAANAWRDDGWVPNPDVTIKSYDDNPKDGFFVLVPIVRAEGHEVVEVPELPNDGMGGRSFVKQHAKALSD
jgi:predicted transcriptional regulator YdeE